MKLAMPTKAARSVPPGTKSVFAVCECFTRCVSDAWIVPPQRLAKHERSLLRFVRYDIPGVNKPMLYFGMLFSMFCWHVEDNYMYSVSYLHEGAPKTWYGVGAAHAADFDAVAADHAFAQAVECDPQLLLKKNLMVPPSMLIKHGVPVSRATQLPGQFVVTLPKAYHAGFSHGWNAAEAVNFMLPDWLPYASAAVAWYRELERQSVLDFEQILVDAAAQRHSRAAIATLRQLLDEELQRRECLRRAGVREQPMAEEERDARHGRGPPCSRCGHVCHLSFVQATHADAKRDRTQRRARDVVCTRHAADFTAAEAPVLFTRYSDSFLLGLVTPTESPASEDPPLLPPPPPAPPVPKTLARVLKEQRLLREEQRLQRAEHKRQRRRPRG